MSNKDLVQELSDEMEKLRSSFSSPLPPAIIIIKRMRSSSVMKIESAKGKKGDYQISINERIIPLNDKELVIKSFRHMLIHLWQTSLKKRQSHTEEFSNIARKIRASDPDSLARPRSSYKKLTYICPSGCQQFRSDDSIVVLCYHCGRKMRALSPSAYAKLRAEHRREIQKTKELIKRSLIKDD